MSRRPHHDRPIQVQLHDAFADLFGQVLRLCADAGMVMVGVISIDGTNIVADGSMSANRFHEWLTAQARRIAGDVVADADATDAGVDAAEADNGCSGELPEKFATRKGRAANIKKAFEEDSVPRGGAIRVGEPCGS